MPPDPPTIVCHYGLPLTKILATPLTDALTEGLAELEPSYEMISLLTSATVDNNILKI